MHRIPFCSMWLVLAIGLAVAPAAQDIPANVVLINGVVLTVDAKDTTAEAVAITNGKIVAVGTNVEIKRLISDHTRVIDLRGRTVTPGLIDTHCHVQENLDQLDLGDVSIKTVGDVIDRLRQRVSTLEPGEWVRGRGWDEWKLAERRYLYASDLDKAAPKNPVWLTHTTGHYGVGNSVALKLAGITKDTKVAGRIVYDADR